ncbi:hypothetical protein ZIOFF_060057 [Zingiber officinale]|uniref:Protein kinase domain-containing protein n=1 Tax=Zingiber officinale TaxID=94328 RepID=A0A8J5FA95_ZINOF|nr:hypothetical protein ZIOFF_060057 [Zingiber officinale]
MVDSVDVVLEFLRKNRFTNAEAALRGELNARPDLNGFLQKHLSVEKEEVGRNAGEVGSARQQNSNNHRPETSKECIVKEIEVGGSGNGFNNKKGRGFGQDRNSDSVDLYPLNFGSSASNSDLLSKDSGAIVNHFADLLIPEEPKHRRITFVSEKRDRAVGTEPDQQAEQRTSYAKDRDKAVLEVKPEIRQPSDYKDKNAYSQDHFVNDLWVKAEDSFKGCSVKTVFPFPMDTTSSSCSGLPNEKNEFKHKDGSNNESRKEQLDEFSGSYFLVKSEENAVTNGWKSFDLPAIGENHRDELPKLPPVRLKSEDKLLSTQLVEKAGQHGSGMKVSNADSTFMIGSFLDVPVGQEINSSGGRRTIGSSWLSVSQGIAEDTSDLVSGIATFDNQLKMKPGFWHMKSTIQVIMRKEHTMRSIEVGRSHQRNSLIEDDQHGSVRSVGVGINSDAADIGSEVRESLVGGSSEGDMEFFPDHNVTEFGIRHPQGGTTSSDLNKLKKEKMKENKRDSYIWAYKKDLSLPGVSADGAFSFQPYKTASMLEVDSNKTLCSGKSGDAVKSFDECANGLVSEDALVTWRRKSSDSSPVRSSRDGKTSDAIRSQNSSASSASDYGYDETNNIRKRHYEANEIKEEDPGAALEDEEVAALQEQLRQIKAQEEEFETFYLKIDKNFHVVLNSVIAGRYHVTEYLGSAAFSKAIQAHDLHTGMDVCVKIIKNNKDFFDQSLDEIKLLKFVNKHDPADKYHILRLYDYFYYQEHLLIVCELLKANLYEFHKFNRESGGEVYFTMPRLQSITIQCLEALQFLHGLGLIHCDLKPENILVKSYSRCEVKVIDLGSSCFETDNLCSYVQSRSYRAPEVILGLPYDKKIDIWSLGCILAELCTGNVLFQNDSPATLLARVIGIIGPIDQGMLAKGHDTYKYFTKNHMLYEKNQETNRLEYLIPKKTSLRHRLPMGDQGFIDFVAHLLEVNPRKRSSASEALNHPWLSYPYEPISS